MRKTTFFIAFVVLACLALIVFQAVRVLTPSEASAYSNDDFKNAAAEFAQNSETAGTPITLRSNDAFYYYVPFTVNSTIPGTFPGIMLDKDAQPVRDKTLLVELYRYPGLIKQFADNIVNFDDIAVKKAPAISKYCRILEVQKIKLDEVNTQGNVVGVIYYGIKLAGDAVGMVQSGIKGIAVLAKDLAKGAVKDSIKKYVTGADAREILENTQAAFDAANKAHKSCKAAFNEWGSLVSTTGKADPKNAALATQDLRVMFTNEALAIRNLKTGFERINNYPKIVTKITKKKFQSGTKDLGKLIDALNEEADYWKQINENANDSNNLGLWADEQIDRTEPEEVTGGGGISEEFEDEEAVVEDEEEELSVTACASVDLSQDNKLYTYTPDTPGTNGPCRAFANSVTSNQVTLSCATDNRFRNHWVKKISVNNADTMNITVDLTMDAGRFFTECPNGGVKYDNYSSLIVLSRDPTPTFDAECNKVCAQADWPKCGINTASDTDPFKPYILGMCGVPKCATSQACDFDVNTAGLNEIYLVFHTSNPWPAYVKGGMSNLEVCPTGEL